LIRFRSASDKERTASAAASLPQATRDAVESAARAQHRKLSNMLLHIVMEWLDRNPGPTVKVAAARRSTKRG